MSQKLEIVFIPNLLSTERAQKEIKKEGGKVYKKIRQLNNGKASCSLSTSDAQFNRSNLTHLKIIVFSANEFSFHS